MFTTMFRRATPPKETVTVKEGDKIPFNGIAKSGYARVDRGAIEGVSEPADIDPDGGGRVDVREGMFVIVGELVIERT